MGAATTVVVRLARVIVPGQITWQVHAYGLVGGVFVLSVCLMVLSVVIFAGALLGALVVQRRAGGGTDAAGGSDSVLTAAGIDSVTDERLPIPPRAGQHPARGDHRVATHDSATSVQGAAGDVDQEWPDQEFSAR